MTQHPFDILSLEDYGNLIFTPCPGTKGIDLKTSLAQLKQAGAQAVITMMSNDEMNRLAVEALPQACNELGLQWFHLPVEDDSAPSTDFQQAWKKQSPEVHRLLEQKNSLAIHCRGGSGRTGLMAAIILLDLGIEFDQAVSMVKQLRPNSLKVPSHLEFLTQYYQYKITGRRT